MFRCVEIGEPSTPPITGQMFFDPTNFSTYIYTGTNWDELVINDNVVVDAAYYVTIDNFIEQLLEI